MSVCMSFVLLAYDRVEEVLIEGKFPFVRDFIEPDLRRGMETAEG